MLCSGAEVHRVEGQWENRRHNLWNVGLCGDAVTGCFKMCLWHSFCFNLRDYPFHLLWLLTENSGTYHDITVSGNAKSICTMYPPLEEKRNNLDPTVLSNCWPMSKLSSKDLEKVIFTKLYFVSESQSSGTTAPHA